MPSWWCLTSHIVEGVGYLLKKGAVGQLLSLNEWMQGNRLIPPNTPDLEFVLRVAAYPGWSRDV